jgi:hypothetical protein
MNMHEKLMKKLKQKGEDGKLSEVEKHAKMNVVNALRDQASSMMGDHLKGLQKVTVASDKPEGLDLGLQKAREMLAEKYPHESNGEVSPEYHYSGEEDEGTPEEEASESPEEEAMEEHGEHEESPEEESHESPEEEKREDEEMRKKLMKHKR